MVGRFGAMALVLGGAALLASSCVEPTEVTLVVTTSAPCTPGLDTDIYVASGAPAANAKTCTPAQPNNEVGSIVLLPKASDPTQVLVRLVASIDSSKKSATECASAFASPTPDPTALASCVEAKRSVSFIKHKGLRLPINIDSACAGVVCKDNTTCIAGKCATIVTSCADDGTCSTPDAGAVDATSDVNVPDVYAPDTSAPDAGKPAIPASLYAAGDGTCVLTSKGNVQCWGYSTGAFGDPSTLAKLPIPTSIGKSSIVALSVGITHSCAVLGSQQIECWGSNTLREVDPTANAFAYIDSTLPPTLAGAAAIAVGDNHSCAVITLNLQKVITCWGTSKLGQTGPSASGKFNTLHVAATDVTTLAAGANHTCALVNGTFKPVGSGAVYCWGAADHGQTGDKAGAGTFVADPNNGFLLGMTVLGAGASGSFASSSKSAYFWGDDTTGQLSASTPSLGPFNAAANPFLGGSVPVVQVAVGTTHACAVDAKGTLACWGKGDAVGGVSNGLMDARVTLKLAGATMVAVGSAHTCVIADSSKSPGVKAVYCFGADSKYQLGDNGLAGTTSSPVEIPLAPEP